MRFSMIRYLDKRADLVQYQVYDAVGEPPADVKKEEMKQKKTIVEMEVNKTPYPVAHFNHLCKTDKEKEKEFYPPCDTEFLSPLDSIRMG